MRCQNCGYISFDHLSACKKCGGDAAAARDALGLVAGRPTMPFFLGALVSGAQSAPVVAAPLEKVSDDADTLFAEIDFGSDDLSFELTEEPPPLKAPMPAAGAAMSSQMSSQSRGREMTEMDDIEIDIGSAPDEDLVLDMSSLDESPSKAMFKEEDFQLDFALMEPKPVASAKAPASKDSNGKSALDDDLGLDLDSEFNLELNLDEPSPPRPSRGLESTLGVAGAHDDDLVIDLGDDDLHGLLKELEESKKGAKAVA